MNSKDLPKLYRLFLKSLPSKYRDHKFYRETLLNMKMDDNYPTFLNDFKIYLFQSKEYRVISDIIIELIKFTNITKSI